MAEVKKTRVTKAQKSAEIERFKMGEIGYLGLSMFDGVSTDEIKKELMWPRSIDTFKEMQAHSSISAPLTMFENIIGKATYVFKDPPNATAEEKKRTEILNQMKDDMEHTFTDFIKDTLSSNVFGFAVHEKVFRKRFTSTGSKFNDGLIGWKKLPIRNQETIEKFEFSSDGNDILGVKQNLSRISDPYNRYKDRLQSEITLPMSKIMLFRAGRHRGDPFGKSMLRDAYLAWRYLTALEELEAQGVAKDLNGLPIIRVPVQILASDASDADKAQRAYFENIIRNIQINNQSGVLLPQLIDDASKQPLYDIELLSTDGRKNYDTTKVKDYYKNLIYTSMFADVLQLGQSSTGSFALAQIKNSLSGNMAEGIIKNILDVINNDLVRQTYELNNWPIENMSYLDVESLESTDLETLSKAVQRYGATGFLPKTVEVINMVLESIGVDALPLDTNLDELLPEKTTRSGDGLVEGLPSGTGSADGSSGNASDMNTENNA